MALLSEWVILRHAVVRIELGENLDYRLSYGDLVVYEPGCRRVGGRSTAYTVRSVEKLRYDFERDVEAVSGWLV
ncbi:MAG: hypothetical protein ABR570_17715 [Burkholderiales bacterium]